MMIEIRDVFAVQIEDHVYHYGCQPDGVDFTEDDIIERGNEESDTLYFCDGCRKPIY